MEVEKQSIKHSRKTKRNGCREWRMGGWMVRHEWAGGLFDTLIFRQIDTYMQIARYPST